MSHILRPESRGARSRGRPDAPPSCPACGKVASHLADLADGRSIAACQCGTWSTYRLSPETGRLALVERRDATVRQRRAL
jgi:hypothetical protein